MLSEYNQESSIYCKKIDEFKVKSEIDNLAFLVEQEQLGLGSNIQEQEDSRKVMRKAGYNFIEKAKFEIKKKQNAKIYELAKELGQFLTSNGVSIFGLDKGKGHALIYTAWAEEMLNSHIESSYQPVPKHQNSPLKYLQYKEGQVRRLSKELKEKTKGFSITDVEYKNMNTAQSRLSHHILKAKIHKFNEITEGEHGNGSPIVLKEFEMGKIPIKFRYISPFNQSPTTNLGKVLGQILLPLQTTDYRLESIADIAKDIQNNGRDYPISIGETFVSFDAISMYDNLTIELVMHCLKIRKMEFEEKTGRSIDFKVLEKCIRLCYSEGIQYKDRIFHQVNQSPTGHPISSAIQNLVLSTYELMVYKPFIEKKKIMLYKR